MQSITYGSAILGVDAISVSVEVSVEQGQKVFIVGLPDSAVKESQQRVEAAIKHLGYKFPRIKVVVNLAPADIRKEGAAYDLPIALGILAASGQVMGQDLKDYMIMGELALDGKIRPVKGALPMAIEAKKQGKKGLILPSENAQEASVVDEVTVYGVEHLSEVLDFFDGKMELEKVRPEANGFVNSKENVLSDFSDVKGQENIKRALEIAAAGGHNVLLIGPPGAGKTMLAKRFSGILPPLTIEEALETTKIHSVAGKLGYNRGVVHSRPFRSPHHTISDVALVGGGGVPQPGEISLAHNGVLFLDELPEFKRTVLEVMRQPLEERRVTISRAKVSVDFPANFMLMASMNPCPCGYYNHPEKDCVCGPGVIQRYLNKISGPLLDRIDLHVEVTPVSFDEMIGNEKPESSAQIRERVINSRKVQAERFAAYPAIYSNAMMPTQIVKKVCEIDTPSKTLLKAAMEKLGLSARAYDRIIKVARTIADLEGTEKIQTNHVAEAIQYRSLDREGWGNSVF